MTEKKEGLDIVQIMCIIGGVFLAVYVMRTLGYSGILPGAIAGAIGAVGGTVLGELIKRLRNR